MAPHTKSARRTTDRVEDVAAWVLIAAGLLVVLFSYGIGAQICKPELGTCSGGARRARTDISPTAL